MNSSFMNFTSAPSRQKAPSPRPTQRLPYLRELGISAVELMPLADFPGSRNWGYDGVDLFAPARCYGEPDDLRRFVDQAHQLGLSVLLDVVYNHLGPEGNYLSQFSHSYYSETKNTLWGPAINLDGPRSRPVREFFLQNALMWVHEYRIDGFRLDATHHLFDESPRHLLAEISRKVRESVTDRPIHLIAEDPRNLASIVQPETAGGWDFDGVWSDDFHHDLRRYLVGDDEGVFVDFRGSLDDLVTTINRGWLFCGAYSKYRGYHRGSDPSGLDPRRFVFCIQNHDRIGNRAHGERLNHQVDLATYRAVSALLLVCPCTPLLFMGQEWASSAPFLFFTDHPEELAVKVREGRLQEFRHYRTFSDPAQAAAIPDCQAVSTFEACKLSWSEREQEPHAGIERFYRAWLEIRAREPALREHALRSPSRRHPRPRHSLRASFLALRRAAPVPRQTQRVGTGGLERGLARTEFPADLVGARSLHRGTTLRPGASASSSGEQGAFSDL